MSPNIISQLQDIVANGDTSNEVIFATALLALGNQPTVATPTPAPAPAPVNSTPVSTDTTTATQ
jgi:hypothetical protein